jgi:hypothetical protein
MGSKVLLRKQQKVARQTNRIDQQAPLSTVRQGHNSTHSKTSVIGTNNNENDGFKINAHNAQYLHTAKAADSHRETCLNESLYARVQDYKHQEHDSPNQEYGSDEDNDDEQSGIVEHCYNGGRKEESEEDEELNHVPVSNVITTLKEKTNLARKTYNMFCEKIGTMDNQTVFQETVRRTTRKQAWKNFKLVDEDDYHYGSTFAMFIFESLGIERETIPMGVERQELWLKFKKYVSEGMQAARSSATQAIKKQFIGKRIGGIFI